MKKLLILVLCLALGAPLAGCGRTEGPAQEEPAAPSPAPAGETLTFLHGAATADVWFLPDTEANRKTTLWGTASLSKLPPDTPQTVSLDALGGPGTYLLRAIDEKGVYYSVNGVALSAGCTVRLLRGEGFNQVSAEVTNADGTKEHYDGFAGRL